MAVREEEMTKRSNSWTAAAWLLAAAASLGPVPDATAKIEGVTGTSFTLVAKAGHISTADGNSTTSAASRTTRPIPGSG